jgi:hypothetical protein
LGGFDRVLRINGAWLHMARRLTCCDVNFTAETAATTAATPATAPRRCTVAMFDLRIDEEVNQRQYFLSYSGNFCQHEACANYAHNGFA